MSPLPKQAFRVKSPHVSVGGAPCAPRLQCFPVRQGHAGVGNRPSGRYGWVAAGVRGAMYAGRSRPCASSIRDHEVTFQAKDLRDGTGDHGPQAQAFVEEDKSTFQ